MLAVARFARSRCDVAGGELCLVEESLDFRLLSCQGISFAEAPKIGIFL